MLKRRIKNLISNKSSNVYKTLNIIEISRSRLLFNAKYIQEMNNNFFIIPVLKANAYGHGLIQCSEILNDFDCDLVAVDGYFEATKIIDLTRHKVLVLGYINPDNFYLLDTNRCSFVVQDVDSLKRFGELNKRVNVHIEINTGMNRLGLNSDEIDDYLNELKKYPKMILEGIMTHLADADNDIDSSYSENQVEQFDEIVEKIIQAGFNPKYIHIAQTAGSVKVKSKFANSIRLGIGLYGINPLSKKDKSHNTLDSLKPILELKSTIVKKINLKKGDRVSYNGIYEAPSDMSIGVLPLGYYEGVPRDLSNKGIVEFNNEYLGMVGRVCMNHVMINLHGINSKVGDIVTVISNDKKHQNSVMNICQTNDLFNYSFITGLSESTRRIIVD